VSKAHSTRSRSPDKPNKPDKPYPEFPLTAHPAGYWCKKIRGKIHYFGPWDDPEGALKKYEEQKDALHAGKTPRSDPEALTVKDVANAYMRAKKQAVEASELSIRTWQDYRSIMRMMLKGFGPRKPVAALDPQDFAALKNKLAKKNSPPRVSTIVQVIRCAFRYVYETGLLDRPMRFGPVFKRTSKKVLRLYKAKQGAKLFTAEEVRRLLDASDVQMRAMILLGINCGYGNADCGTLRLSVLDLERGIIDYPRPKTGIARRCALWPETIAALREVLANRKEPKDRSNADLVFITKYRQSWYKIDNPGPLTHAMRKLLTKLGIDGHRNFYTLRHTFRTVADEAKDQPAADYIMGHEVAHMSSVYRETISDARLKAVTDHVRAWLLAAPSRPEAAAPSEPAATDIGAASPTCPE
jgi:integrase